MKYIFWKTNKLIIGLLLLFMGQSFAVLFAQNFINDFYNLESLFEDSNVYGVVNESITFHTEGSGGFADITIVSEPEHGMLNQNIQSNFVYNPDQGYVGMDNFVLSVCFGPFGCDTLNVQITLLNETDLPIAQDDFLVVGADSPLYIDPVENDVLSFNWNDINNWYDISILTDAENGTVELNTQWDWELIVYTPNAGFEGQDSIQYELCQNDNCEAAWIYINVTGESILDTCIVFVQNVLVVENSTYELPMNEGCFAFFDDFVFLQTPLNGNLSFEFNTPLVYVPDNNFVGTDTIVYQFQCDNTTCFEYHLLVEVLPESDLPIQAIPDLFFLGENAEEAVFNVLDNDIFENNDDITLTISNPSSLGTATVSPSGNEILYTLDIPEGSDFALLNYEICDQNTDLCSDTYVLIVLDDSVMNTCEDEAFCVYPGDANNDSFVDMLDFLTLGYNFGEIGLPRLWASSDWEPQTSLDWEAENIAIVASNEIEDSLEMIVQNAKYADCDGNGIVTEDDIAVIDQNYALLVGKDESDLDSTNALIWIDLPEIVETNTWITADVYLGTMEQPVDSVYGLSFSVEFNSNTIDPSSVSATIETNDWVDIPSENSISLVKPLPAASRVDIGITRINLQNEIEFQGKVSRVNLFVIDDVDGKNEDLALEASISNAVLTTSQGEAKVLAAASDVAEIITGVEDANNGNSINQIQIFPNPTSRTLTIRSPLTMNAVHVMNSNGQIVYRSATITNSTQMQLDLGHLPTGIYFVAIQGNEGQHYQKVELLK